MNKLYKSIIKIAILDDEDLFRQGVELLIHDEDTRRVIFSSSKSSDFFDFLGSNQQIPDVVLLDIRMQPIDGFEVAKRIQQNFNTVKIIMLSSYYDDSFIIQMVQLGVSSFLPKNTSKDILITAIESVFYNDVYLTDQDHRVLMSGISEVNTKFWNSTSEKLSEREIEVVKLVCEEYTNKEISDKLFISKRTVENHRLRINEKLGLKNTAGLVIYAILSGIYKPDYSVFSSKS